MGKGLAEVSESWKKWIIRVSLDTFIHESIGKIEQGKTHLGIVVKQRLVQVFTKRRVGGFALFSQLSHEIGDFPFHLGDF